MTAGFSNGKVSMPLGEASGTWTPVIDGSISTPTVGYTNQLGWYYEIGNLVTATFLLTWTTASGGLGQMRVGGLPYTIRNLTQQKWIGSVLTEGLDVGATTSSLCLEGAENTQHMLLIGSVNISTIVIVGVPISATGTIRGSITYVKG